MPKKMPPLKKGERAPSGLSVTHRRELLRGQLNVVDAAQELSRRRAARVRMHEYVQYVLPYYQMDAFHAKVCDVLQSVVDDSALGISRWIILCAPPQHGKSLLCSIALPSYWLGRYPEHPIIMASYGANLVQNHSRAARGIVEGAEYARLYGSHSCYDLPVITDSESRSVETWGLANHTGKVVAAGVGGPVTGHGAQLGIIDDPYENWEQAQSPAARERVWMWWKGTFRTRLHEGASVVLMMTRWNEDDLVGRLLLEDKTEGTHKWELYRFPALSEMQEERDLADSAMGLPTGQPDILGRQPDNALATHRYTANALKEIKRDVGTVVWYPEYQQFPRPLEGNLVKRAWLTGKHVVDEVPADAYRVRYWDKAGTSGDGAFTAGVLLAMDRFNRVYIEDVVRGQWSAGKREERIEEVVTLDHERLGERLLREWFEQEPGSGGKESAENTIRGLAGYRVAAETVQGSKDVRFQPFVAQCEALNVYLLRGVWNAEYVLEICSVPYGRYRDQADGSGGALAKLREERNTARTVFGTPNVITREELMEAVGTSLRLAPPGYLLRR